MTDRILLPIDLQHEASWAGALPEAVAQAKLRGAELHLLTIVPDFGMTMVADHFPPGFEREMLEKAMLDLKDFCAERVPEGVECHVHVKHGHPAEAILESADDLGASLIVMASHHPDRLRSLLVGSVADKVVHNARQSVLILRKEGS